MYLVLLLCCCWCCSFDVVGAFRVSLPSDNRFVSLYKAPSVIGPRSQAKTLLPSFILTSKPFISSRKEEDRYFSGSKKPVWDDADQPAIRRNYFLDCHAGTDCQQTIHYEDEEDEDFYYSKYDPPNRETVIVSHKGEDEDEGREHVNNEVVEIIEERLKDRVEEPVRPKYPPKPNYYKPYPLSASLSSSNRRQPVSIPVKSYNYQDNTSTSSSISASAGSSHINYTPPRSPYDPFAFHAQNTRKKKPQRRQQKKNGRFGPLLLTDSRLGIPELQLPSYQKQLYTKPHRRQPSRPRNHLLHQPPTKRHYFPVVDYDFRVVNRQPQQYVTKSNSHY